MGSRQRKERKRIFYRPEIISLWTLFMSHRERRRSSDRCSELERDRDRSQVKTSFMWVEEKDLTMEQKKRQEFSRVLSWPDFVKLSVEKRSFIYGFLFFSLYQTLGWVTHVRVSLVGSVINLASSQGLEEREGERERERDVSPFSLSIYPSALKIIAPESHAAKCRPFIAFN